MSHQIWVRENVAGLRQLAEWITKELKDVPYDTPVQAGVTMDRFGRDLSKSGISIEVEL